MFISPVGPLQSEMERMCEWEKGLWRDGVHSLKQLMRHQLPPSLLLAGGEEEEEENDNGSGDEGCYGQHHLKESPSTSSLISFKSRAAAQDRRMSLDATSNRHHHRHPRRRGTCSRGDCWEWRKGKPPRHLTSSPLLPSRNNNIYATWPKNNNNNNNNNYDITSTSFEDFENLSLNFDSLDTPLLQGVGGDGRDIWADGREGGEAWADGREGGEVWEDGKEGGEVWEDGREGGEVWEDGRERANAGARDMYGREGREGIGGSGGGREGRDKYEEGRGGFERKGSKNADERKEKGAEERDGGSLWTQVARLRRSVEATMKLLQRLLQQALHRHTSRRLLLQLSNILKASAQAGVGDDDDGDDGGGDDGDGGGDDGDGSVGTDGDGSVGTDGGDEDGEKGGGDGDDSLFTRTLLVLKGRLLEMKEKAERLQEVVVDVVVVVNVDVVVDVDVAVVVNVAVVVVIVFVEFFSVFIIFVISLFCSSYYSHTSFSLSFTPPLFLHLPLFFFLLSLPLTHTSSSLTHTSLLFTHTSFSHDLFFTATCQQELSDVLQAQPCK